MDNNENPPRQLLLLIKEFNAEKSKRDSRISDLKKRLIELQRDYESANVEIERAKGVRETSERDLRGSQAQLDRTDALMHSMEARNMRLQDEISQVSSELQAIKDEGMILREEFIVGMDELNRKIRKFNKMALHGHPGITSDNEQEMVYESKISSLEARILLLKEEYEFLVYDVNKVHKELANLDQEVHLRETVAGQSERLKNLSVEVEKTNCIMREELHKKYKCPKCMFDNMEASECTPEADQTTAD